MSPRERLTITLTDRQPVSITTAHWPVLATAADDWHDGEIEAQANRRRKWRLIVRQHADGPAIVYGVYQYDSQHPSERSVEYRGGELLEVSASQVPDLPAAIRRVGEDLAGRITGENGERMREVIHECIAALPARDLG